MNHALELRRLLAERLNEVLRQKTWNQTDIARNLQTTQPRISKLQRGNLEEISIEQLVQWLAAMGHAVELKTVERAISPRTERFLRLLELGRGALDKGELQGAKLWADTLWREFPREVPAGALKYEVLTALGYTLDAQGYKRFKDAEQAGTGQIGVR